MNTKPIILTLSALMFATIISHAQAAVSADDSFYDVQITAKLTGDKKAIVVHAVGKAGYHCNIQYPWKISLRAGADQPAEVVLTKTQAKTFSEKEMVFEATTSSKVIEAEIKMSYCDEKGCKMEKRVYKF